MAAIFPTWVPNTRGFRQMTTATPGIVINTFTFNPSTRELDRYFPKLSNSRIVPNMLPAALFKLSTSTISQVKFKDLIVEKTW